MELTSLDRALVLAQTRGRIEGLQITLGLPQAMIDDLAQDIANAQEELQMDEHMAEEHVDD